jgi:hypothetical protein
MADFEERVQKIVEELSGNEALMEMLDTDAATEMLNWGTSMVAFLVKRTEDLDNITADLAMLPRLKAVRQSMRSIGNWAAGKYVDPESRLQLRDKLLEQFRVIFGDDAKLPEPQAVDAVLNEVDDTSQTPHQLILRFKQLLEHLI